MSQTHLDACVRESLEAYFQDLHGVEPHNMYDMLIKSVESPLLEVVMRRANNNQSRAAQWLGLNRNTLRKKLLEPALPAGAGPVCASWFARSSAHSLAHSSGDSSGGLERLFLLLDS